ncbi:MAG: WecB/TagA/CpsF family glycosyltransferase [bacterium]|nr:WecB/TagA/CpsF family glycosyltransferase [bacterium]
MSKQTKFPKYNILGVEVDALTIRQAINYIFENLQSKKRNNIYITKPYVEFIVKASRDKKIAKILKKSELCLADGVSLQKAASFIYGKKKVNLIRSLFWISSDQQWLSQVLPERMAGTNFTIPLFELCQKNNYRIGIIGGKEPQKLMIRLKKIFPKLNLAQTWNGFFDEDQESEIVKNIASNNLDILFVAMGFPRQEFFIYNNLKKLNTKIAIGEGGTFDYRQLGGNLARAPQPLQKVGLEWLWRLFLQPKRFLRQITIFKFFLLVYKQAKNYSKTPLR